MLATQKVPLRALCVFCGASPGNNPKHIAAAKALGDEIVKRNMTLVYGERGGQWRSLMSRQGATFLHSTLAVLKCRAMADWIIFRCMQCFKANLGTMEAVNVHILLPGVILCSNCCSTAAIANACVIKKIVRPQAADRLALWERLHQPWQRRGALSR